MMQQVVKSERVIVEGNMLADAHCHLELFQDPETVVKDAVFGGVGVIITAGGSKAASVEAIKIADGKNIFAVIGIDPENAAKDSDFIDDIAAFIRSEAKIVGIGEIGIDNKVMTNKQSQIEAFEKQINIAIELDIPVVIHSRGALNETIDIIRKSGIKKAMFHFFEGNSEDAVEVARLGFLISIPPVESSRRKRVIQAVGIESLVVETDSPVVGKSPLDVIKTAQWIAGIKGIGYDEVSAQMTKNVKNLFLI